MANINTYAKLIKPVQFRPNEEIRIRMEYSQNLTCCYATLIIDGYSITMKNGNQYSGYKTTQYINESFVGTGIEEFVIPPNTLAEQPVENFLYNGKVRARVEIGKELNSDGNVIPQFTSNEILLDMLMGFPNDFMIGYAPLTATASNYEIQIGYVVRYDFGSAGATDMNSLNVFLYDENYNLLSDSGVIYDCNFTSIYNKRYTLENLEDNTNYYVRVKGTLVGGYILWTDYVSLSVHYEDVPTISSKLTLENNPNKGCVRCVLKEDLLHDKVIISRTQLNRDEYIELTKINNPNESIIYEDYYALPNTTYIYKAVSYNENEIVGTYYNIVTHNLDGVVIADIFGHYTALTYESIYPINKNDRFGIIETMDREKPFGICNGETNYDSGSVKGLFTKVTDDCKDFDNPVDNITYSQSMREWLNNGRAKLLKYHTGESWIVVVNGVNDENNKDNIVYTSFNWTEIAKSKDLSAYVKEGLIINEY